MYYDLRFAYRIIGTCEDYYFETVMGRCKNPINSEMYDEMHRRQISDIANLLHVDVERVIPVTGEEYEANADMEE